MWSGICNKLIYSSKSAVCCMILQFSAFCHKPGEVIWNELIKFNLFIFPCRGHDKREVYGGVLMSVTHAGQILAKNLHSSTGPRVTFSSYQQYGIHITFWDHFPSVTKTSWEVRKVKYYWNWNVVMTVTVMIVTTVYRETIIILTRCY